VLLALAMLPAAYWSAAPTRVPAKAGKAASTREVLRQAMRKRPYVVMSGAYFV